MEVLSQASTRPCAVLSTRRTSVRAYVLLLNLNTSKMSCSRDGSCSGGFCQRPVPPGRSVPELPSRLELYVYDVGSSYVLLEYATRTSGSEFSRFQVDMLKSEGESEAQWTTVSKELKGGFVKKKGLSSSTAYSFRIRGLMVPQKEWSPYSPVRKVETLSDIEESMRPMNVQSTLEEAASNALGGAKLRIHWTPVGEADHRFQVEYRQMAAVGQPWALVSDQLKGNQVIKKNIPPGSDWVCRVRAETKADGPWTAWSSPSAPTSTIPTLDQAYYRLFGTDPGVLVKGPTLSSVPLESLTNKLVALYFSASWCPPCQQFTPRLVQFYNEVISSGRMFEVIFVSADKDEASFRNYFSKMPWVAVDFRNAKRTEISSFYQVQGIPRVIVSANG